MSDDFSPAQERLKETIEGLMTEDPLTPHQLDVLPTHV